MSNPRCILCFKPILGENRCTCFTDKYTRDANRSRNPFCRPNPDPGTGNGPGYGPGYGHGPGPGPGPGVGPGYGSRPGPGPGPPPRSFLPGAQRHATEMAGGVLDLETKSLRTTQPSPARSCSSRPISAARPWANRSSIRRITLPRLSISGACRPAAT